MGRVKIVKRRARPRSGACNRSHEVRLTQDAPNAPKGGRKVEWVGLRLLIDAATVFGMSPWPQSLIPSGPVTGSRSTALTPLLWVLWTFSTATLGPPSFGVQTGWVQMLFGALLALDFLAFLGAYFYLMVNNPGALRSEKHAIQKYAIEKGFKGDDTTPERRETIFDQLFSKAVTAQPSEKGKSSDTSDEDETE